MHEARRGLEGDAARRLTYGAALEHATSHRIDR
jgi:hypothetical protein